METHNTTAAHPLTNHCVQASEPSLRVCVCVCVKDWSVNGETDRKGVGRGYGKDLCVCGFVEVAQKSEMLPCWFLKVAKKRSSNVFQHIRGWNENLEELWPRLRMCAYQRWSALLRQEYSSNLSLTSNLALEHAAVQLHVAIVILFILDFSNFWQGAALCCCQANVLRWRLPVAGTWRAGCPSAVQQPDNLCRGGGPFAKA